MGRRARRWILELVVYVALMLTFGALATAPFASHVGLVERLFVFGGLGFLAAGCVVQLRVKRFRWARDRPAAVEALTTLDLSSAESRRTFLRAAGAYVSWPFDTIDKRIEDLAGELNGSSADRRDFGELEPLLADARECLRIERSLEPLVTRVRKLRTRGPDSLRPHERKTLLCGLLVPPLSLCLLRGLDGPFVGIRVMLPFVLFFPAVFAALSWTSPRRHRAEHAVASWLRQEGLPDDPFTVRVALGALGRADDPTD